MSGEMLGALLRQLQADVRSLRSEQGILRRQVSDAGTALLDRTGQSDEVIAATRA